MRKFFHVFLFVFFAVFAEVNAQEADSLAQVGPADDKPQPTLVQTQPTAAQLKIGYFSYNEALCAMSQYSIAQANLKALRSQFDMEMQSAEKEFSEKYENFLEEQRNMAAAIRDKRQSELQLMMDRNVSFRKEAERLLAKAEADAMAPLHQALAEVIKRVAEERAYIMVVNTDSNACPYLNPTMAEDISTIIIDALK